MTVQSPETGQRRTIRSRPPSRHEAPPKPPALRAVLRAAPCSACGLAGRRARFRSRRPPSINVIELRSRARLRRRAGARPPSAATTVMTARRPALRAERSRRQLRRDRDGIDDAGDGTTAPVTAGSLRLNAAHCRRRQCRRQCPFPPARPSALPRTPLRFPSVTTTAPRDPGHRPKPRDRPSWIRRSRPIPARASVYRSCIGRTSDVYRPCIARIAAQCARDREARASPLEGIPKGPRNRLRILRPARRSGQAVDPERVSGPYPACSTPHLGKHGKNTPSVSRMARAMRRNARGTGRPGRAPSKESRKARGTGSGPSGPPDLRGKPLIQNGFPGRTPGAVRRNSENTKKHDLGLTHCVRMARAMRVPCAPDGDTRSPGCDSPAAPGLATGPFRALPLKRRSGYHVDPARFSIPDHGCRRLLPT